MIAIDEDLTPESLLPLIGRMWELSAAKIDSIEASSKEDDPAPVFTVRGQYTARGWTEWTLGFRFGSALLQFDGTEDERFLDLGRRGTSERMSELVTPFGVHDHGFQIVSTFGNWLRLVREGRIRDRRGERQWLELGLRASGAVQARRWSTTVAGTGYIPSFNGAHSLFADTIRSLRSLALAHGLGQALHGEHDEAISLLGRLIEHAQTTARYAIFYGEGRDRYDVRGRVAHESLFNPADGHYRAPSTQQGYSPFSTWTRGLAWVICGYGELLEWLPTIPDSQLAPHGGRDSIRSMMLRAARATADYYLESTPSCGVPYWDTGAPGLARMGDWGSRPAEPFNEHEPVDSSAAAIASQGLLRLGRLLGIDGPAAEGKRYWQAGLAVLRTLLGEPYLSTDPRHQGLCLHAVYHRPNSWDYVPPGRSVPCGESCLWGDFHLREAALLVQRVARCENHLTFFGPGDKLSAP